MKMSDLIPFLAASIEARLPVLVVGGPGEGKSAAVKEAAALVGADWIQSHPAIEDPTDPKGLPNFNRDGEAEFIPFGQLRRARAAERLTVWNVEDLGQATPAVQAAYMPLFDAARGGELPNVVFIATSNRRTDRAGVSGILEPVKSRFASIVEIELCVQALCAWGIRSGIIPAEMLAFWRFRPELVSKFNPSADLTNSPSPRTWEAAAKYFALDLPKATRAEALAGAVGQAAASEFLAFVDMFAQLPSIDGILLDPDNSKLPAEPSAMYATVTALAARAGADAFPRVARYAERLTSNGAGDMGALLVLDSVRRHPEVQTTPAFVRLVSGEMGSLIAGS